MFQSVGDISHGFNYLSMGIVLVKHELCWFQSKLWNSGIDFGRVFFVIIALKKSCYKNDRNSY
jgi:hypothetical protein